MKNAKMTSRRIVIKSMAESNLFGGRRRRDVRQARTVPGTSWRPASGGMSSLSLRARPEKSSRRLAPVSPGSAPFREDIVVVARIAAVHLAQRARAEERCAIGERCVGRDLQT